MNIILKSDKFDDWLSNLRDKKAKAKIALRLGRAEQGNFGDCEPVGEGVSEMRIHYGPGYRVYLMREGLEVYLLLSGGDKSTQAADIKAALKMARELKQAQVKE